VLTDREPRFFGRCGRGYTVLRHGGFLDLIGYGCDLADGSGVDALGPSLFWGDDLKRARRSDGDASFAVARCENDQVDALSDADLAFFHLLDHATAGQGVSAAVGRRRDFLTHLSGFLGSGCCEKLQKSGYMRQPEWQRK